MKPAGIILTKMIWNKPKYWPFNVVLLAWQIVFLTVGKIYGKVDVQWRRIWRAATIVHVRLCLGECLTPHVNWFISFTAPRVKFEMWRLNMVAGRFSYHDPTFDVSEAEEEAMNAYAEKIESNPVARKYDYLALLSYMVNLIIWIIYPSSWGREVIKWFNLPSREVCSSGITADLRWAFKRPFFNSYHTQMVSPCLFDIDKNWRR